MWSQVFFSIVAMHSHLYCVGQISVLCWSVSTFFTCNLLLVLSAAIIGYHYKGRKIFFFETISLVFVGVFSFQVVSESRSITLSHSYEVHYRTTTSVQTHRVIVTATNRGSWRSHVLCYDRLPPSYIS